MRIAVWHNLPSGGGRRLLGDQLRHLVAAGHQLHVWTTPQSLHELQALPAGSDGVDTHVVDLRLRWDRGRIWSPLPPSFVVLDRLRAMDRHLDQVAAQMDDWAPDVVLAGACRLLRSVGLGSRTAAPAVVYLGEPYRWLYEASSARPWTVGGRTGVRRLTYGTDRMAWSRQLAAEISAAAGFDTLLVNSMYSRESVLRAYGLESTVCYPGVDAQAFVPVAAADPPYIVSVGALAPEKRPELVIDAMATMEHAGVPLVWVANAAEPGYAASVRTYAANAGVRLDLRLRVSDQGLRAAVGGATAMVYAPRLEPFGLAPLEAAAAGVPSVVVPEAGVRETVRHAVTGLHASTPEEIGAGLDRLLGDPALRRTLGGQARADVLERWDLPAAGRRLEAFLRDAARLSPADPRG
jgi:glycosyltransferase involved in cell wall biosynthesis